MNYQLPPKKVWIPLLAVQAILMIAGISSIKSKPLPMSEKWKWIPVLFVDIIGPIIYFTIGSKWLDEKAAALHDAS